MSLKHAILGFLEIRPLSGYDLKKAFDGSVQHFWPADQAQIYRTLNQLTDAEMVEIEEILQEDKPDRKVYHITENGRFEFTKWLGKPAEHKPSREPFLVRLFFAGMVDEETAVTILQQEMEQNNANLNQLRALLENAQVKIEQLDNPEQQRIGFFQMLTIERGLLQVEAEGRFIESVLTRVQNHNYKIDT